MFCHIFLDPCVRQTSQCFTPYTSSKGGYIPTQQGLNLSTGDSWGPIFLCHGGILSTIGCLAQFLLLSTRCQWHPLLFVTTKNVFRHCQMSPGRREYNCPPEICYTEGQQNMQVICHKNYIFNVILSKYFLLMNWINSENSKYLLEANAPI